MKHARDDYNRIQDPDGKIPEDEPVFLIRGQDHAAVSAIYAWILAHEKNGGDPRLTRLALNHLELIKDWQKKYGAKVADL